MQSLISHLRYNGYVKSPEVITAMTLIDRIHYVGQYVSSAYNDHPLPILDNATISAPHMHAECLERFKSKIIPSAESTEPIRVLDLGSGSGILTSYFAAMLAPNVAQYIHEGKSVPLEDPVVKRELRNKVIGIEHMKGLMEKSLKNIDEDPVAKELTKLGLINIYQGDGRKGVDGVWSEVKHIFDSDSDSSIHLTSDQSFDVIHVGAAASTIPDQLLKQLKIGGVLVLPVGPPHGHQELIKVVRKGEDEWTKTTLMGVRYVPFTSVEKQESQNF